MHIAPLLIALLAISVAWYAFGRLGSWARSGSAGTLLEGALLLYLSAAAGLYTLEQAHTSGSIKCPMRGCRDLALKATEPDTFNLYFGALIAGCILCVILGTVSLSYFLKRCNTGQA